MKLHLEILELRKEEKRICSTILDKLQIMESQRGYLDMGYSSLFDYLVRGLGYSESTAYQRQSCVRLSKEVPEIKQKIDEGKLSLTTLTIAYKGIKSQPTEKKREVLKKIENKSTREVKKMFLDPAKEIQIKETHYQDRVHIRLELNHENHQKLERLRRLKSHQGNLEELFMKWVDRELKDFDKVELKSTTSKNPRYIPKRLRNAVLLKAKYKCQHPGCESEHFLQVDHIKPVRWGGEAKPENLQVLCGAHNRSKG